MMRRFLFAVMLASLTSTAWSERINSTGTQNAVTSGFEQATGNVFMIRVNSDGEIIVDTSGGVAGLATEVTLAALLAKIIAAPSTEAKQDDQITELQAILAKIIAAPATEAKQDTGNTSLASILAKIIAAPATEAKQDTMIVDLASIAAEDFATQTTLAAVLAKIIAAPATEAKQDTMITDLASIAAEDFATQTTLAAVLAKIIAAPSTEVKQDSAISELQSILAKIIAAPSTEAKQDSAITELQSILAKIIAAPATEAKQDDNITQVTAIELNTDSPTVFASGTISVGSTAVEIAAPSATRRSLLIHNADSNTVLFVGPTSGVTTANGLPLNISGATGANGNGGTVIYTHTAAVWGIVSSGTADTRFQSESD